MFSDLFRRFPAPKNKIKSLFNMIGIEIRAQYKFMPELWSDDLEFEEFYRSIMGVTKVSKDRCFMIHQLSKYSGCLDGDMAEVGVYKGGTAKLIASSCKNKKIHLFDTFSGMPEVSQVDKHREKDFSDTCLNEVKSYLKDCHNASFYPETARPLEDKIFCFVYIDVDLYQSTKACLEFFFPRMVPGGIILFDDYNWPYCPGVEKAIGEFFIDKREEVIITARFQGMIIKIAP